MRSRRTSQDQLAEVARRRLELLSAELAEIRPQQPPAAQAATDAGRRSPGSTPEQSSGSQGRHVVEREPLTTLRGDGPAEVRGSQGIAAGRHAHRSVGSAGRLSGWVRDRLPPTLQGGASMSMAHLAVVVAALVAGVLATVWWVSTTDDADSSVLPVSAPSSLVSVPPAASAGSPTDDGPSAAPSSAASGSGAGGPGPATAPSASGTVVVDVAGRVRRPGIATLPLGARVVDALEAAGGPRRGVRLGALNLARVLTDGEQIVVGVPAPPGVAASAASAPTSAPGAAAAVPMVNINTAGQAELEQLPGIGPVTAQAILAFRSERGTFSSVDELLEVSGIGDATLADMAPYVTL
jgi:competence protein ComEA